MPVLELIKEKLPVSISLGMWMTFISYAISIPLGVSKAVRDASRFDTATSALVIFGYAIPSFLFAVLLVVLSAAARSGRSSRCAGSPPTISPISPGRRNFRLSLAHHAAGDVVVLGSFATWTLLTKNSFLDEIKKSYVQTARMKGLTERRVLYGHVFRNAMLIVIAGNCRRLHRRVLYRLAPDRAGVLARRSRLSLLQIADSARLPGGARQPLYLRPDRAGE